MFEFGVYVGPAIVIFGMLLALIGFLVWGSGAIRESAAEAELAMAGDNTAAETSSEIGISEISLPELSVVSDMEKTAEFSQPLDIVPTFSQSFLEGQEVSPGGQSADYNAAIDRIKADLEASDNEDEDQEDDTIFDYGAGDFVGFDLYEDEAETAENATAEIDEEIIEAANVVEALQNNHANQQAAAEVLNENTTEEVSEDSEKPAAVESIAPENDTEDGLGEQADAGQAADEKTDIEQAAMEETMILRYPKQGSAKAGADELLDATALEETRMHNDILAQAGGGAEAPDRTLVSAADLADLEDVPEEGILIPEAPKPFGPKMAWLAIPGFKPSEVIALLRLGDVKSANWTMGLTQAYADNNQVFVSPSLGGWVLVIGKTIWQKGEMNRSAEKTPWLNEIGRRFGNVCFFTTMKGLGNHGWVGIRDGRIARAYGYSGEVGELIWFEGEPTEEEEIINPAFVDEAQERYQPGFRPVIPDEKMVLAMAAAWSVDTSFRRRQYPPDFGFLGTMN